MQQIWGSDLTTFEYDGDGNLVEQELWSTSGPGGTTRYAQDLASPLSQVLATTQGGSTTSYLYGLERLAALNGTTRTWYVPDALSSARRTIGQYGVPGATISYDPWGQPQFGARRPPSASPASFTTARVDVI